jgi:glucokinase
MHKVLAFDIGGTKIAWAVIDEQGKVYDRGVEPTPQERDTLVADIAKVITSHPEGDAAGLGVPGPIARDKQTVLFCTNISSLTKFNLGKAVSEIAKKPVVLDNDARCALVGEAWLGVAAGERSVVMVTLGTGVGGAVMQRGVVLPSPSDVSQEISRLIADPDDIFPGTTGKGTVEAMIGGKSLEMRYNISLKEMSEQVRTGNPEAVEFWSYAQHAFAQCARTIHQVYGCHIIIVGGKGMTDLEYYVGEQDMPCPVVPATLGSDSGLFGAAQLAFEAATVAAKDWDEE